MKKLDGWESTTRKLSALAVNRAAPKSKQYKLSDGYGLNLVINTSGGKYWRYNYRILGRHKTLALGAYPDVSLREARERHREAYNQVLEGVDPAEERKVEKLMRHQSASDTFESLAREWLEVHMEGKSESHRTRSERLLIKELCPHLASRPISEITTLELLAVLRGIESRGTVDTAHRARGVAKQVFAYAIATGRAERNIANDLQGTLKTHRQKHRAAILEPELLGKLLNDMEKSTAGIVVRTAMQLSPILFQRPGEIRHMEWQEIDFDKALWEIPADKMKMRNAHIVPLSRQAIALLRQIQPVTGNGKYVFPSARGGSRCLSDNGVRTALRDMGYSNEVITPHGFRATARTLLDEELDYRVDYIEHQLAHAVKDANGRAYNRTSFIEQRKKMMQAWADYLDKLKYGTEVVSIKF